MKLCFHIGRRLWAYCDGVVSLEERARIEEHFESCARCRARVAHISENIRLIRQASLLDPADELWDSIEKGLSSDIRRQMHRDVVPKRLLGLGKRWVLRPAAIVASLAIILTALFFASRYGLLPGSQKGEFNLAGYLDQVSAVVSADTNLKEFPAAFGFTGVSLTEARAAVSFPVISPESLPEGYVLTAVRLYTCEDFSALQLKYRSEKEGLCVFQSPANLKLSFGDRQSQRCTAGGVQCRRTSSPGCHTYGFTLGDTRCVVMTGQTDQALIDELIKAFNTEYYETQQRR